MIDTSNWKEFLLDDYFDISAGIYHYPEEYEEGNTPYVSASKVDNGIVQYINLKPDFEGNKIVTGKIGCTAFYELEPFCATSDVNIFTPKFDMSTNVGIFLVTIINFNENYKWAYGRQCRVGNSKKISILLPATFDDKPDWLYMEDFMCSLKSKPLTTSIKSAFTKLNTGDWKEFFLHDLFDICRGNGLSKTYLEDNDEGIAFISRQSYDNGVNGRVSKVAGKKPFSKGNITVALGGEYLGSSFIQNESFYTGAHIAVLRPKTEMTFMCKLFITRLIRYESAYKYQAFGRELDSHIDNEFSIYLPQAPNGNPNWGWIENYMKSLPFSDRILY